MTRPLPPEPVGGVAAMRQDQNWLRKREHKKDPPKKKHTALSKHAASIPRPNNKGLNFRLLLIAL